VVPNVRPGAVALVVATLTGCSHSDARHSVAPRPANSPTSRADRAAVTAAADASGILTPFRPSRLGTFSCALPILGPPALKHRVVHGTCETRVLRGAGGRRVIFRESWNARDFRGSGDRFRQPGSRSRLTTSWRIDVAPSGRVRHATVSGDFPPQLVM
jgi:hypothetical protein